MSNPIGWCTDTINPIVGCSHVGSPACDHCYAARMAVRLGGNPATPQYKGLATMTKDGPRWTGEVRWIDGVLDKALRWKKPRRIFVGSMTDLFHKEVPFWWVDRILAAVALTPQHTWMILTKRPERMREHVSQRTPEQWREHLSNVALARWGCEADCFVANSIGGCLADGLNVGWPMRNLLLGVTVEDQQRADERIPVLLSIPAAKRFVSMEPLLGAVDITPWDSCDQCGKLRNSFDPYNELGKPWASELCHNHYNPYGGCDGVYREHALSWLIAGGETGPGARPSYPEWFGSLRDQCAAAGVPFYFKGWGAERPYAGGGEHVPRHLLDGREHREVPNA